MTSEVRHNFNLFQAKVSLYENMLGELDINTLYAERRALGPSVKIDCTQNKHQTNLQQQLLEMQTKKTEYENVMEASGMILKKMLTESSYKKVNAIIQETTKGIRNNVGTVNTSTIGKAISTSKSNNEMNKKWRSFFKDIVSNEISINLSSYGKTMSSIMASSSASLLRNKKTEDTPSTASLLKNIKNKKTENIPSTSSIITNARKPFTENTKFTSSFTITTAQQ